MQKTPGHTALRKGRVDASGQVYLVTTATAARTRRFEDAQAARAVCRTINDSGTWRPSRRLAWVLMPDHWHGLIELGDEDRLTQAMRRFKERAARAVNLVQGAQGAVWAAAFHDHALRRDEGLIAAARYVVANPVRAGLVRRAGDYPYWDAIWL
jgi:putative transposase